MLDEYINAYIDAAISKNTKEAKRIEKELATLGMDKITLTILANELYAERKAKNDSNVSRGNC